MNFALQGFPIENGFSVKFSAISPKEELRPRKFGTLFAKIPQQSKSQEELRRDQILNTIWFPQKLELPDGYSNQVAKLLFPTESEYNRNSNILTRLLAEYWRGLNYLNMPVVSQPYDNYKVLVATAPPNMRFGGDYKQTFIYVVFPENGTEDSGIYNAPVVYFVHENTGTNNSMKDLDPILVVDSNRTVTSIKSKEIVKFIKFKNKSLNRFKNKLSKIEANALLI